MTENRKTDEDGGMEPIGWAVLGFLVLVFLLGFTPVAFPDQDPIPDNQGRVISPSREFGSGEDEGFLIPPPSLLGDDVDEESAPPDSSPPNKIDNTRALSI